MTPYEIIASLIAICALVISALSYKKAYDTSKEASVSNNIAMAQLELSVNQRITETKEAITEISVNLAKYCEKDKALDILKKSLNVAIENNLNAYEAACSKYIDEKIDKDRFKKDYTVEIRQLVQKTDYSKYFDRNSTNYHCILKVFDEWNNLEK